MFKKSFFSIILIISLFSSMLFLLPACSCSKKSELLPPSSQVGGFVGGNVGLGVNVLSGAPPSVIQDAGLTPFSFVVALENAGEAKVGPGTDNPFILVRLAGIKYENFGLTMDSASISPDFMLEPAKRNFDGTVMRGEISHVTFDNLAYMPNVFESFAITMRAEVCYDYETYATVKLCMKKDILEAWEDASICTLKGPKPFGTSGAPIQITFVEENPVNADTVQLNFMIEHVGNGVFFSRNDDSSGLFEVCAFDDMNPEIYKLEVFVEPIEQGMYEVDCLRLDNQLPGGGAHGIIRTYRGAPITMSCFLKQVQPVNVRIYEDLVNIKLRYRYGEFLDVPVLIQGHP